MHIELFYIDIIAEKITVSSLILSGNLNKYRLNEKIEESIRFIIIFLK